MFSLYFTLISVRKLSIGKIVIKVKFVFLKVCIPVYLVGKGPSINLKDIRKFSAILDPSLPMSAEPYPLPEVRI